MSDWVSIEELLYSQTMLILAPLAKTFVPFPSITGDPETRKALLQYTVSVNNVFMHVNHKLIRNTTGQFKKFCPGFTDQLALKQDNSYNLVVKHVRDAGTE